MHLHLYTYMHTCTCDFLIYYQTYENHKCHRLHTNLHEIQKKAKKKTGTIQLKKSSFNWNRSYSKKNLSYSTETEVIQMKYKSSNRNMNCLTETEVIQMKHKSFNRSINCWTDVYVWFKWNTGRNLFNWNRSHSSEIQVIQMKHR